MCSSLPLSGFDVDFHVSPLEPAKCQVGPSFFNYLNKLV